MDNFEKHIRNNRQFFDESSPDRAKIWDAISDELESKNRKVIPFWNTPKFKVAASIVIILGMFGAVGLEAGDNSKKVVNQELKEIDMHYQSIIAEQVKLVDNNSYLNSMQKEEFLSFMTDLNKDYKFLKLELEENLDNELVLEAIIDNYQKRLELIDGLLEQTNNSNIINNKNEYIL